MQSPGTSFMHVGVWHVPGWSVVIRDLSFYHLHGQAPSYNSHAHGCLRRLQLVVPTQRRHPHGGGDAGAPSADCFQLVQAPCTAPAAGRVARRCPAIWSRGRSWLPLSVIQIETLPTRPVGANISFSSSHCCCKTAACPLLCTGPKERAILSTTERPMPSAQVLHFQACNGILRRS